MSILGNILGKIFPSFKSAEAATPPAPKNEEASAAAAAAGAARAANATPSPAAMEQVDVEALLDGLAQKNTQKLNWKTSIVDLMKLLDLDSSLSERKELAKELGYTQDTSDSAAMNIWLHRQVMNKLAANGGKVPSELKD
jgi:3-oxoacyl-ACP reductase-like protein